MFSRVVIATALVFAVPLLSNADDKPAKDRDAEVEALKKEVEALRRKVEALGKQEPPRQISEKIVVTSPLAKDVVVTQRYVGKILAQRHINIRPLASGFITEVLFKEGQAVKQGDVLFRILPTIYQAKLDEKLAELNIAQVEFDKAKKLFEQKVVSYQEVALHEGKLAKARARVKLAEAELNFTRVKAPFDGIVGRVEQQVGSLVKDDETTLTTLSDNSVMWVSFKLPEVRYLEFARANKLERNSGRLKLADSRIELLLADGSKFKHAAGDTVTCLSMFDSDTGPITFRADFPNPDRLLRHGQTGTVVIYRTLKNAIMIPQRATFEIAGTRYVYALGADDDVHQHAITIEHELDGMFVVKSGLKVTDRIVLEGGRQLRDGDKVKYEFRKPEEVLSSPPENPKSK